MISLRVEEGIIPRPEHIMVEFFSKTNVFLSIFFYLNVDGLPQLCLHTATLVMGTKFSRTHGKVSSEHLIIFTHW